MPRFPSSTAHAMPVGPAPAMATERTFSATRAFYGDDRICRFARAGRSQTLSPSFWWIGKGPKKGAFPNEIHGVLLALSQGVRIRLILGDPPTPERKLTGGSISLTEVLEGEEEFLQAVAARINEIVAKPQGRYAISYVPGSPGARRPPRRS
jgi:hypothetical protein